MDAKLTLTLDERIIKAATEYATSKGSSLSGMVEDYFKSLIKNKEVDTEVLSPKISRLRGVISLPQDFNYKNEFAAEVIKKQSR